jgi:hypothetical protein
LDDCHPFQRAVVETLARFITLLVGRGGGKTTSMRARDIRKLATVRRGKLIYFAKTREQTRELMWNPIRDSLEVYEARLGNELYENWEFSEARLTVTCRRTGATMRLLGMDDAAEIEKLRGQPFDQVDIDEAASHKPELLANLIDRIIGPRLGERKGCIVLGGTPGFILRGPFYDFTRPGASVAGSDGQPVPLHVPYRELEHHPGWRGYVSFAWTLRDVLDIPGAAEKYPALANLWDETELIKANNRWTDENPIWLREYKGQWAADDTGLVFRYKPHVDGKEWNRWTPFGTEQPIAGVQGLRIAVDKLHALHPEFTDWRYVITGDSGTSDPWACNVFTLSPQDSERRLWHVFCYEQVGMYSKLFSQLVQGQEQTAAAAAGRPMSKLGGLMSVTGWPDAMGIDADGDTVSTLQKEYGLNFTKMDHNPMSKMGTIETVNGDLIEGRIKIIHKSTLEEQLQSLQWSEDVHGNVKESKAQANHCTDCLIYARRLVALLFESGSVVEDSKPAPPQEYRDPQQLTSEPVDARDAGGGEFSDLLSSAEWADISL